MWWLMFVLAVWLSVGALTAQLFGAFVRVADGIHGNGTKTTGTRRGLIERR
jgi:hypothetical protein